MPDEQIHTPNLIFFRDLPKELMDHPPLASSLQHLETSFLLVAIRRYPHALVNCGSAIESALKAAIRADTDGRSDFRKLISKARELFPLFTTLSDDEIKNFRFKRNDIIHYGFSPKDDDISAELLLKTGYTLIEHCYKAFFQFPLVGKDGVHGGLLPDFARHLNIARNVYNKAKEKQGLSLSYCFLSFAHRIRQYIQPEMTSDWQKDVLDSEAGGGQRSWEYMYKQKRELDGKSFVNSWEFDCPVCHSFENFICELDVNQLKIGKIALNRGVCVDCSFVIPKNTPFLADELCKDQFEEEMPKILKDYGIA